MKHAKFSRKAIYLSIGSLIIVILCSAIILRARINEVPKTYADVTHSDIEIATRAKESELSNILRKLDKVDDASIKLTANNEPVTASIFLTTSGIFSDSEIDNMVLTVSKSVESLDKENICILNQDGNAIYPSKYQ